MAVVGHKVLASPLDREGRPRTLLMMPVEEVAAGMAAMVVTTVRWAVAVAPAILAELIKERLMQVSRSEMEKLLFQLLNIISR